MKIYMKESLDLKVPKLRVSKYWGLDEIQSNTVCSRVALTLITTPEAQRPKYH